MCALTLTIICRSSWCSACEQLMSPAGGRFSALMWRIFLVKGFCGQIKPVWSITQNDDKAAAVDGPTIVLPFLVLETEMLRGAEWKLTHVWGE